MTYYRYKAMTPEGRLYKGEFEGSSIRELKTHLHSLKLSLIRYHWVPSFHFLQKGKQRMLLDFCFHLDLFERAGIPLKDSLKFLHDAQTNLKFKAILFQVIRDLEGGTAFSKTLEKYPSVFDSVFVGLVAAGEKMGNFSLVFPHLFQHLVWKEDIQAQALKSFRYPLMMVCILICVILCLMTTLVPELALFVKSFSEDLPLSMRILIQVADFLPIFICFFIVISGISLVYFQMHPEGVLWKDFMLDKVPILGAFRQKINLARACHVFAILFESGVDVFQILHIARKSLPQGRLSRSLEDAEKLIKEGLTLSEAFQKVSFFPPILIQMIKMGEQTSSLQRTLFHVKQFVDTSLKRQAEFIIGAIEPFMLMSVGLVLGFIIYAVFLPIYDTLSSIGY